MTSSSNQLCRAPAINQSLIARVFCAAPRILRRHKIIRSAIRAFPGARIATFRFNRTAFITADLHDSAARQALITGEFEPEFYAIAEPFLIDESALLDVGANNGFCTFGLMANIDPVRRISAHLFEANERLYETLKLSRELYPFQPIFINHGCVTDSPGVSSLKIDENHWGGSYIVDGGYGQRVSNIVLDEYLDRNQVPRVSLLKMDIEGHEYKAIKGLEKSIMGGRIGALYIECSSGNLERQGSSVPELLALLRGLACRLYWCRAQDLAEFGGGRQIFPQVGRAGLRLAPLENFPSTYQTDILAIPAAGPHQSVFQSFGP